MPKKSSAIDPTEADSVLFLNSRTSRLGVLDPGLVPDEQREHRQAAEDRAEHARAPPRHAVAALHDAEHDSTRPRTEASTPR